MFVQPKHFEIKTYWDGRPCEDEKLWGTVDLVGTEEGLKMTATLPWQEKPKVPEVEEGERVANLWEYDVVECFLVGKEKYLEVELGAGGHFLVLDFTATRVRDNEYADFCPTLAYKKNVTDHVGRDQRGRRWESTITIPWEMVPDGLHAANAFVIVGENYLCATPLPGEKADFHQPGRFNKI